MDSTSRTGVMPRRRPRSRSCLVVARTSHHETFQIGAWSRSSTSAFGPHVLRTHRQPLQHDLRGCRRTPWTRVRTFSMQRSRWMDQAMTQAIRPRRPKWGHSAGHSIALVRIRWNPSDARSRTCRECDLESLRKPLITHLWRATHLGACGCGVDSIRQRQYLMARMLGPNGSERRAPISTPTSRMCSPRPVATGPPSMSAS